MSAFEIVHAAAVPQRPGRHPAASPHDRDIGSALGVRSFGVYQVELPPGGESVAHDHAADRAEDVYAIVRGGGTVLVDGEAVPALPGAFIAVAPDSTRRVCAGDDGLVYIAVCAPRA